MKEEKEILLKVEELVAKGHECLEEGDKISDAALTNAKADALLWVLLEEKEL